MKKILIGSVLTLSAIVLLSSCKKDYTCECDSEMVKPEVVVGGVVTEPAENYYDTNIVIINDNHKNAEITCDNYSAKWTDGQYTTTVICNVTND